MNELQIAEYSRVRSGAGAAFRQPRGLVAVWGKEAVQFLDGMITNDMKTLADGQEMLSAFPNAQGRLLAVVRVLRQGDRFLIETEGTTRDKVFQNLYRFTFAGDFFVEDLSDQYAYFELFNERDADGGLRFSTGRSGGLFLPVGDAGDAALDGYQSISPEVYEVLRIENGLPLYGVDMDETTIVPELGLDGLISYTKGCYIGQEIIARIHFRGHVAKSLTGLVFEANKIDREAAELFTMEGKNAGKVTSVTYSPKLERTIALGFVRYDNLAESTVLTTQQGIKASVKPLPFI